MQISLILKVFHPWQIHISWDKLFWWAFLTARATGVDIAAESLPCIVAISAYDETWICLTSPGRHKGPNSKAGHPGAKLAAGPAEEQPASHHLHTAAGSVSLDMSPPPHQPPTPAHPVTPTPTPTPSSSDKPHLHPSHIPTPTPNISPVHLICPSCGPNSMWRQHYGLSCELLSFCRRADSQTPICAPLLTL